MLRRALGGRPLRHGHRDAVLVGHAQIELGQRPPGREADVEDVAQEVLLGAWQAYVAGRYLPDTRASPDKALVTWLLGITRRQASHARERAHVRREVPTSWLDGVAPDELSRLEARPELARVGELVAGFGAHALAAVTGAALGEPAERWAPEGLAPSTAARVLIRTRERLAHLCAVPLPERATTTRAGRGATHRRAA